MKMGSNRIVPLLFVCVCIGVTLQHLPLCIRTRIDFMGLTSCNETLSCF